MAVERYRWYSKDPLAANFDPRTDLNDAFFEEVRTMRSFFGLRSAAFGYDVSKNKAKCWVPFYIHDSAKELDQTVLVKVQRLRWNKFHVIESRDDGLPYHGAHFVLDTMLANPDSGVEPPSPFYRKRLKILLNPTHPTGIPRFFVCDRPEGLSIEAHHWWGDGLLCISPAKSAAWWGAHHSIPRHIALAIAWMLWHFQQHGY
jgi:hypothetical protein